MKRVLITRSPHQASELAERLRAVGLEPILIPTIEIAPPASFAALDAAVDCLDSFEWMIFTSANAVEAFAQRAAKVGAPFIAQANRIAVIGPATARAVEALGWKPDLVPPQAVAESLAAALLPYVRQPLDATGQARPTRFLLVRAETGRDHLPDTLRAAGGEVEVVPAYRTVIPAGSVAQMQSLFSEPSLWPDAVTFTSSSTAIHLQALLEACGVALPAEVRRVSIGPITSKTLRELNLAPDAEAEEPTVAALAAAVVRALGAAMGDASRNR